MCQQNAKYYCRKYIIVGTPGNISEALCSLSAYPLCCFSILTPPEGKRGALPNDLAARKGSWLFLCGRRWLSPAGALDRVGAAAAGNMQTALGVRCSPWLESCSPSIPQFLINACKLQTFKVFYIDLYSFDSPRTRLEVQQFSNTGWKSCWGLSKLFPYICILKSKG